MGGALYNRAPNCLFFRVKEGQKSNWRSYRPASWQVSKRWPSLTCAGERRRSSKSHVLIPLIKFVSGWAFLGQTNATTNALLEPSRPGRWAAGDWLEQQQQQQQCQRRLSDSLVLQSSAQWRLNSAGLIPLSKWLAQTQQLSSPDLSSTNTGGSLSWGFRLTDWVFGQRELQAHKRHSGIIRLS